MNMKLDLIVKNGWVVLPDEVRKLDIGIRDGRIEALAECLDNYNADSYIDADGQHVLPGMIDSHVHFNEPGLGDWEGFATGSAALAAGGCTTYVDMPLNGNPPTVSVDALKLKLEKAKGCSVVDYTLWGGLVPKQEDQLEMLAAEGIVGFKAFMSNPGGEGEGRFREIDDWTLFNGMRRIAAVGGFVALHAESDVITTRLAEEAAAAGKTDAVAFIASRPVIAELEAVNKALLFAEHTGCSIHFVHISAPETLHLIQRAKDRGLEVTVETCPHYLLLTDQDMIELGPIAKCAPPLRSAAQQEEMWELLSEGYLDIIGSDHSPSPPSMKFGEGLTFTQAWGGISGAQSSLELMIDEGYLKRGIPLPVLTKLLSSNPAKRFELYPRKGEIAIGSDADLAIVDTNHSYKLLPEHLFYRHQQSPYVNRTIHCRVTTTLCRGKVVYVLDEGITLPTEGQSLLANRMGSVPI